MNEDEEDKDETKKEKVVPLLETISNQIVIPIYNGHTQSECTFEEYVENLPKDQPINWSKI